MENCDISAIQIQSECFRNGKPKSWPKYRFPTYSIDAETKCLPLSYNLSKKPGKEPNPQVCCDLPTCNNCIQGGDFVRLGCFHTFHVSCLPSDHCCSICKEPLKKLIKNKTVQFNEGLLKNGNSDTDDDLSESDTDDDTIEGNNEVTDTNAE